MTLFIRILVFNVDLTIILYSIMIMTMVITIKITDIDHDEADK